MSDMSFVYDSEKGFADIAIADGDFVLGDDLQTAVGLSLFTDRRATNSELVALQAGIIERQSRRGYWANAFRRYTQGSGLWLLSRAKRQEIARSRAGTYALECLQWLKQDGIAKGVDADVAFFGSSGLDIAIRITKPSGEELNFKYQFVWS